MERHAHSDGHQQPRAFAVDDTTVRIAYLVNQYPMASLTFIRREIAALESMGHHVARFALQRWVEDPQRHHGPVTNQRCELASDCLDLGQFRHGNLDAV